jgi:hypothetical protein
MANYSTRLIIIWLPRRLRRLYLYCRRYYEKELKIIRFSMFCMRQTISINEERIQHLEEQSHDSMYEIATPQETE